MGCNGNGSGVCLVLSGRRAWAVLLMFALLGSGAGKALAQAPADADNATTLTFGDQQVGTRSDAQPIHLQNTGKVELVIKDIQASASFAETDDCRPSVAVGKHCTVQVIFSPTATGPLIGTITVSSNAAGPPHVFKVDGIGVLTAPDISPSKLSFGEQSVGTASASQTVTFTNTGTLALTFTGLTISGGWTQSNDCLPSVPPKGSCTIKVNFRPASFGWVNGALTLTDYTSNSPQTIALTGTGVAPPANTTSQR